VRDDHEPIGLLRRQPVYRITRGARPRRSDVSAAAAGPLVDVVSGFVQRVGPRQIDLAAGEGIESESRGRRRSGGCRGRLG